MKTAEEFYNLKYPKHTRLLKKWVIELMEGYAHQLYPTDKEIEEWAEKEWGCSGTQTVHCIREVNIAIKAATAVRDNKIPHKY